MQDPPDKTALLAATAEFLMKQVRPQVKDPDVRYRLLIAAHLCGVVTRELIAEDTHNATELGRLAALLQTKQCALPSRSVEQNLFRDLNRQLAEGIKQGDVPFEEALSHLTATLSDKLLVLNPQFDLSEEIE